MKCEKCSKPETLLKPLILKKEKNCLLCKKCHHEISTELSKITRLRLEEMDREIKAYIRAWIIEK